MLLPSALFRGCSPVGRTIGNVSLSSCRGLDLPQIVLARSYRVEQNICRHFLTSELHRLSAFSDLPAGRPAGGRRSARLPGNGSCWPLDNTFRPGTVCD